MPTIRRAEIADLEQVVTLRMAFLREMHSDASEPEAEVAEMTRRYLAEKMPSGEFLTWFAEEDGRIVGVGSALFWRRPPTFHYKSDLHAYILNMYTLPEWRGRGIASMLLREIIDHVKATPARRISLHATEMGRPIYERLGFRASDGAMTLDL